jgi:hypothetical protein
MRTYAILTATIAILSACDSTDRAGAPASTSGSAEAVRALPFRIETVMLSDMFQNNLKVAKVNVGVNGGSKLEWGATSVAIAEKVSRFGADSIEVSVRRNDVHQKQGAMFRELAHTYYSPNPQHSVWEGDKKWAIYLADPAHLATQADVDTDEEFSDLNQNLIDRGMDSDAADKKAGAAVAKKYHLPKDWQLPIGNVWMTGDGLPRASLTVDIHEASSSLDELTRCMEGKIIRMLTSCGGQ